MTSGRSGGKMRTLTVLDVPQNPLRHAGLALVVVQQSHEPLRRLRPLLEPASGETLGMFFGSVLPQIG